jgi:hypothetical protein
MNARGMEGSGREMGCQESLVCVTSLLVAWEVVEAREAADVADVADGAEE